MFKDVLSNVFEATLMFYVLEKSPTFSALFMFLEAYKARAEDEMTRLNERMRWKLIRAKSVPCFFWMTEPPALFVPPVHIFLILAIPIILSCPRLLKL